MAFPKSMRVWLIRVHSGLVKRRGGIVISIFDRRKREFPEEDVP